MSEWIETTIGDQATLQRGFDITKAQQRPGSVPVVSSGGVSSQHEEAKVAGPGVVLGRKGVVGSVYFIAEDYWPHDTTLWVRDFHGNDPRFVYYFFRRLAPRLASLDVGSANPTLNRNHVHPIKILWPPLKDQRRIAGLLGALDDKIELNRRMNETLEAMARALFKSWFVDFDPVHAKAEGRQPAHMDADTAALFPDSFDDEGLPVGWEHKPLDEIADFLNGLALQKYPATSDEYLPVIKIVELRQGITAKSGKASLEVPAQYVVKDGDVLFSWSGSLIQTIWAGGRGALNQHLFKVTSEKFPKWFYFFWVDHHLLHFQGIAASKATTMGHIQRHHLTEAQVVVPSTKIFSAADRFIGSIFESIVHNSLESRTLTELRDTLLPKLMSGEIRMRDAEKEGEAVA